MSLYIHNFFAQTTLGVEDASVQISLQQRRFPCNTHFDLGRTFQSLG